MSSDEEGDLQVDVPEAMKAIDSSGVEYSDYDPNDPANFCPICHGSTYEGDTIMCDICSLWYHIECVGVSKDDDVITDKSMEYNCPRCKNKSKSKGRPRGKVKTSKAVIAKQQQPLKKSSRKKSPSIKLKFKLGIDAPSTSTSSVIISPRCSRGTKAVEEDVQVHEDDDDEEQWLDQIESGDPTKIVDPELKPMMNPKLMTARQRAMAERTPGERMSLEEMGHMALDFGKKFKTQTEHDLRVKALKSKKRKEIEMEKREETKKSVVDKLLNKKDSKVVKQQKTLKPSKIELPKITYTLNAKGASISVAKGFEFPFQRQGPIKVLKPVIKCAVCPNLKKYSCSRTGQPLCSLNCYQANLRITEAK